MRQSESNGSVLRKYFKSPAGILALASVSTIAGACGGEQDTSADFTGHQEAAVGVSTAPKMLARVKLASGTTIEFYDFNNRPLVTEIGEAYTTPVLDMSKVRQTRPVDLWATLNPGVSAPSALTEFQVRLDSPTTGTDPEPTIPTNSATGGLVADPALNQAAGGPQVFASPVGCNNGCCDYDWMYSTFSQCRSSGYDYSWFLYNKGWTTVSNSSIDWFDGFVCSASGTSTWTVNISGSGGTWSVPEAHYQTWGWAACLWPWCGSSASSSVNNPSATHLHTYCGGVLND